nr:hypothetical protein [Pectobacterium polaris]
MTQRERFLAEKRRGETRIGYIEPGSIGVVHAGVGLFYRSGG